VTEKLVNESYAEFEKHMTALGPFSKDQPIGVGVSGGKDSMVLSYFLSQWAYRQGRQCYFLTIDHRLRPESRQEALFVHQFLRQQGLHHHILTWDSGVPTAGIQDKARKARYKLIHEWCFRHQIKTFFTAHHFQDQVETFLYRLSCHSTLTGLAGMSAKKDVYGVHILRPLLTMSPQTFSRLLSHVDWPWIDDPSNQNPKYARTQFRNLYQRLQNDGISDDHWTSLLRPLGWIRQTLDHAVDHVMEKHLQVDPFGEAKLCPDIVHLDPKIQIRVWQKLLHGLGGKHFAPNTRKILHVMQKVTPMTGFSPFTSHGCYISFQKSRIVIAREPSNVIQKVEIKPKKVLLWDNRFIFYICNLPNHFELHLKKVGDTGWIALPRALRGEYKKLTSLETLKSLPALWHNNELLEIPNLGYTVQNKSRVQTNEFIGYKNIFDRFFML